MYLVSLPIYEGFNTFVIWSDQQQSVSNYFEVLLGIFIVVQQDTSYYGLLSTERILAPVNNGRTVTLPYYPGCKYAAIPARNSEEVRTLINKYQYKLK